MTILKEFLAVERDGRDLYDAALRLTSGPVYEQLSDFRFEADRRVRLLENALQRLGNTPDEVPAPVLLLEPLMRADERPRHLVEALLLFELRDEVIGETLEAMGREADDPNVAEVLRNAALPIQSNEAFGAHDSTRHRERIAALNEVLRQLVREDAGLGGS